MPVVPIVGAVIGAGASIISSKKASGAARDATAAQMQGQQENLAFQREALAAQEKARQESAALFKPFIDALDPALQEQLALAGLRGDITQQQAISKQLASPQYKALEAAGQEAMARQASAIGGLRGGDVRGAFAQFSPALANQFIGTQWGRLGELVRTGMGAVSGAANANIGAAGNVGDILRGMGQTQAQMGDIQAGGMIERNRINQGLMGSLSQIGGSLLGMGAQGAFGGNSGGFNPAAVQAPDLSRYYMPNAGQIMQGGGPRGIM